MDELGVEVDDRVLDLLAGAAEAVERAVVEELDADLRDQPPPAPIEHGHGLL